MLSPKEAPSRFSLAYLRSGRHGGVMIGRIKSRKSKPGRWDRRRKTDAEVFVKCLVHVTRGKICSLNIADDFQVYKWLMPR